MAVSILIPQCKIHVVISFLHAKEETVAKIQCQLISVYNENVMNKAKHAMNPMNFKKTFIMKK